AVLRSTPHAWNRPQCCRGVDVRSFFQPARRSPMSIHRLSGRSQVIAALASFLLFASSTRAQIPQSPSTEPSEGMEVRTEHSLFREQLRKLEEQQRTIEDQQKTILRLLGELQGERSAATAHQSLPAPRSESVPAGVATGVPKSTAQPIQPD